MGRKTKEMVLEDARKNNVKFIHLQFTDILGTLKNVAITIDQLEKALDGELMFDGSSIEGFVRIEESDMYLKPDPDTFAIFPWPVKQNEKIARIICDIHKYDGSPFEGCPRCNLKRIINKAKALGFTMNAGPEIEFFLFLRDEKGVATTITHDQGGYFDISPLDKGDDARRDIVLALEKMGFEIEASHHEVAPGQHEIDFKYADALTTADNIATFKFVTRKVALDNNLHATFMPKPIYGIAGSGMHTNQSMFKNGENAFYDPSTPNQLSEIALYYMGGLLKYAKEMALITNPLVNSYKRLVPGFEAPINIAWSERNRSPLIRVPARRGIGTRVELRNPDPSCNPYLALAVMLQAGLEGIENKIDPGKPVLSNVYQMSQEEKRELNIDALPHNLGEAINYYENSKVMHSALGDHIYERYLDAKKYEWYSYCEQVHPWEIDNYLVLF
jgi:glutamine synthetase